MSIRLGEDEAARACREWPQGERLAKRAFDVLASVPICLLALPVVVVLAVALGIQLHTWPVFVHERIGPRGADIAIPKLRTLASTFDPYADKTVVAVEAPTRLTRFLRASHLDELPQLFLVPFGVLSLVGPRPRMRAEAERHGDTDYEAVRTSVVQGCTGLWQVSGHRGRVSDRPEYDRFYVEQRTLRLDVWILWRTVRQLLGGARPVDISQIPAWTLRREALTLAEAG